MIAADTTWVAYLDGETGTDVEALDEALVAGRVVLPPVVLTELLSSPKMRPRNASAFTALPQVPLEPGY